MNELLYHLFKINMVLNIGSNIPEYLFIIKYCLRAWLSYSMQKVAQNSWATPTILTEKTTNPYKQKTRNKNRLSFN